MNFFSLFKRSLVYKFKKKILVDNDGISFKNLDQLFYHYGTNKGNSIKQSNDVGYGFSKFYLKHFHDLPKSEINILELGSFSGSSAVAFKKYFENSKVFCFDINISNFKYKSKDIKVFGLDIKNSKKTEKIIKNIFKQNKFDKFDLIIDDGSHNLSDILFSLDYLFKYLKEGGIYVIEDYQYPSYFEYNNDVNHILVDEVIEKLKNKTFFESELIQKNNQKYLFDTIDEINCYKGNLEDADICFIKKKKFK